MKRLAILILGATVVTASASKLEQDNPIKPIPTSPLGITQQLSSLSTPPTPERVRLGRWLFYDKRLSKDSSISCATCHRPEHAFSEPTAVSTGIHGQKGARKAPTVINLAFNLFPHFFWDGRAASLEEQALGPIANPIEMGSSHQSMVGTLNKIKAYKPYFEEAFGTSKITKERVAHAIADYERTRLSGNSPFDRWQAGDKDAVSAQVQLGYQLYLGKGKCIQCHLGQNFTDSRFHNLGVGWNPKTKKFKDVGRFEVSKKVADTGAFKTPSLRDLKTRAPYMHDGSVKDLMGVMVLYIKGGEKNPHLSPLVKPLQLTGDEVQALIAWMGALEGEGYADTAPKYFPN